MGRYTDVRVLGLRNLNGTLKLTVPVEYIRKYGFKAGDNVFWLEPTVTEGGVKSIELVFGNGDDLTNYLLSQEVVE